MQKNNQDKGTPHQTPLNHNNVIVLGDHNSGKPPAPPSQKISYQLPYSKAFPFQLVAHLLESIPFQLVAHLLESIPLSIGGPLA